MSFNQQTLGGGVKGKQAVRLGNSDSSSDRSASRKHLTKAFGNLYNSGLGSSPALHSKDLLGPFKTAFNSGDILTTYTENTDTKYGYQPNQIGGNNLARINPTRDGVSRNGKAMYSGNSRFTHDSSDYTRFRKLQAMNRNFNDLSTGGNSGNYPQHSIRRLRR